MSPTKSRFTSFGAPEGGAGELTGLRRGRQDAADVRHPRAWTLLRRTATRQRPDERQAVGVGFLKRLTVVRTAPCPARIAAGAAQGHGGSRHGDRHETGRTGRCRGTAAGSTSLINSGFEAGSAAWYRVWYQRPLVMFLVVPWVPSPGTK